LFLLLFRLDPLAVFDVKQELLKVKVDVLLIDLVKVPKQRSSIMRLFKLPLDFLAIIHISDTFHVVEVNYLVDVEEDYPWVHV
jgi:hypothetical protein